MTEKEVELLEQLIVNWIIKSKRNCEEDSDPEGWGSKRKIEKIKAKLIGDINNECI